MKIKNPKSLLIISTVIVVLAAGTLLLGSYVNITSDSSDSCAVNALAGCCGGNTNNLCGGESDKLCGDSNSK